jgi:hypothetical protein
MYYKIMISTVKITKGEKGTSQEGVSYLNLE